MDTREKDIENFDYWITWNKYKEIQKGLMKKSNLLKALKEQNGGYRLKAYNKNPNDIN